jgi:hypothetical protein
VTGGGGSRGVILAVWRSPDGCAQAAGIHVMVVGEAAHHERAHLVVWRSPDCCARAAGIHVMVVEEAAHHERAHCRRVQASVGRGKKADETPAGRVMLRVGK